MVVLRTLLTILVGLYRVTQLIQLMNITIKLSDNDLEVIFSIWDKKVEELQLKFT